MTPTPTTPPRFSQTLVAIVGSAVVGLVLATLLTGSPFRATQLAYTDWSRPPAGAAKPAAASAPAAQAPQH